MSVQRGNKTRQTKKSVPSRGVLHPGYCKFFFCCEKGLAMGLWRRMPSSATGSYTPGPTQTSPWLKRQVTVQPGFKQARRQIFSTRRSRRLLPRIHSAIPSVTMSPRLANLNRAHLIYCGSSWFAAPRPPTFTCQNRRTLVLLFCIQTKEKRKNSANYPSTFRLVAMIFPCTNSRETRVSSTCSASDLSDGGLLSLLRHSNQ